MAAMPSLLELASVPSPSVSAALDPLRAEAQAALQGGLTWPNPKSPAWRHTRLTALAEGTWQVAANADDIAQAKRDVAATLPPCLPGEHRLVLVDGVPAWDLCQLPLAEQGTYVADLAEGLGARPHLVAHIDPRGLRHEDALAALSVGRAHHGALVHVAAGASSVVPLEILFVHTGRPQGVNWVQPRVLVVLEPQAQAVLRETHIGEGDRALWSNAATDLALAEGSKLTYALVQAEAYASQHLAHVAATVGRDANLTLCTLDAGSALCRRSLHVDLQGPGAHAQLAHVALARRSQHSDIQSEVRHSAPHTTSQQDFRAALEGLSTAVFSGMVHIVPDAQKVAAKQMSRALIMSPGAQAIIKPQLMILADDVKCAHGATVGQIDDDALFYLTSRGIDPQAAQRMLTFAFLADALSMMPEILRAPLMARACEWLGLDAAISQPMTTQGDAV